MNYRFRLRIAAKQDGKFTFDKLEQTLDLANDLTLALVARNAQSLQKATVFHFEAGGFPDESTARLAGEQLRVRLRLLNAILGLGLNIPAGDTPSSSVSEAIKEKGRVDYDAVAIDGVWGLITFPDDGRHFEYIISGKANARPSDPSYILTGIKALWDIDVQLDQVSELALHIVNLSCLETSEKAAFLTCYLALEQLIGREPRKGPASELVDRFQKHVLKASKRKSRPLSEQETRSLRTAIGNLKKESFKTALMRFAGTISEPKEWKSLPLRKFLSECVKTRDAIAHNANTNSKVPLSDLTAGLRKFVLALIWTRNQLPPISITIPPSAVSTDELTVRVL